MNNVLEVFSPSFIALTVPLRFPDISICIVYNDIYDRWYKLMKFNDFDFCTCRVPSPPCPGPYTYIHVASPIEL